MCENCNKIPANPATKYCKTENAYFCDTCYTEYHNTKVGKKHDKG